MGERDDLYAIIGVAADAARADIVRGYRRQAHQLHPDTHPADPTAAERFRRLTAAYDVLVDPARRRAYDQDRHASSPEPAKTAPPATVSVVGSTAAMTGDVILGIGPVYAEPSSEETLPTRLSTRGLLTIHDRAPILFIERRWL